MLLRSLAPRYCRDGEVGERLRRAITATRFSSLPDQSANKHVVLETMRMVAGKPGTVRMSHSSFTSLRVTSVSPALPYPPLLEAGSRTDVRNTEFQIVFPPATPPGDYLMALNGIDAQGEILSAVLTVHMDAMIVPRAASGRVPVILLFVASGR